MTNKDLILSLIQKSNSALSHQDLVQGIEKKINRVTIYRILDRLIGDGEVHKVIDIDGVSRYAACHQCEDYDHVHDHVHFSCTKCSAVTCLDNIQPSFKMPTNYKVEDVNFTISGVCPKCL